MKMLSNKKAKRGFNLIEAAIVLGVVGLVIGGIWVAAAAVQQNLRNGDASKGLLQIVQNVRNLYYGQSPTATNTDVTSDLISASAIPADFVNNSTSARNPWNGTLVVGIVGTSFDKISVAFGSVPKDSCIELTSRNTNITSGIGLSQLVITNTTNTFTVTGVGTATTNFPVLPTTAAAKCDTTNTITWQFGLRG